MGTATPTDTLQGNAFSLIYIVGRYKQGYNTPNIYHIIWIISVILVWVFHYLKLTILNTMRNILDRSRICYYLCLILLDWSLCLDAQFSIDVTITYSKYSQLDRWQFESWKRRISYLKKKTIWITIYYLVK